MTLTLRSLTARHRIAALVLLLVLALFADSGESCGCDDPGDGWGNHPVRKL